MEIFEYDRNTFFIVFLELSGVQSRPIEDGDTADGFEIMVRGNEVVDRPSLG